ncbi:TetR/AcrR family transcriptional regulator [Cellulomonas chengniuliangii]|uniref:TetR family transcriptional regulator n=1 Tax=Cellulomonas chengniuliangii TaxID=2968084 RepID=A0ABY5L1H9_9CELL|nr:TetR family transcriptional regulator [Cellulomonas chengniuliangii]MCC2307957.1 TetR family transcriptional regulator [Cellulomonas chengniuliangii]UUI75295.1 TetR family transcriptional regulator [Cellulomonas chengniuliangii]
MPPTDPSPAARPRRNDPGRRDRIIGACLDVIAEDGVDGTSHRRVAAHADVPLGSMTYHFSGRDELLREAFTRFTTSTSERFAARLDQVVPGDREGVVQAVVDIIRRDVFPDRRELVLTHELYTLAARDPAYRDLTNAWMRRSRAALERCFDPATARVVDALIEGLTIHRALDTQPCDEADVELAVRRLTQG